MATKMTPEAAAKNSGKTKEKNKSSKDILLLL